MCQVGQYMVYPRPQKYENLEKVAEVRHNVYTSVSCIMNTVITILGVYKDLDMVPLELPEDQVTLSLMSLVAKQPSPFPPPVVRQPKQESPTV